MPPVFRLHLRALSLALDPAPPRVPALGTGALLMLHVAGLALVARLSLQPGWLVLLPLALLAPGAHALRTRRFPAVESLAPLFVVELLAVGRVGVAVVRGSVPEPLGTLLDLGSAAPLAAAWTLLAQAPLLLPGVSANALRSRLGGAVAVLAGAWAAVAYFGARTSGVTASDPYAYVQMAVDFATRGAPVHPFPLATVLAGWGLPSGPAAPLGFAVSPETGLATSVWPPGWAVPLGAAYRVAGEAGLYALAPALGIVTLAAVWMLAREATGHLERRWSSLAAGVAVVVLATSAEQVDRLVVPMADVPAQLFSVLPVWLSLRAVRPRRGQAGTAASSEALSSGCRRGARHRSAPGLSRTDLLAAGLAGLCLGAAFAVRYTQVLVVAGPLAAWTVTWVVRPAERRRVLAVSAVAGVAAWVAALPVLLYHQAYFGSPFQTGSQELGLFSAQSIPENLVAVLGGELFRSTEFLLLAPAILVGLVALARDRPIALTAVVAWVAALVLFHLPYAALRGRDLLPEFPALAILAGVGVAEAARRAVTQRRAWVPAALSFVVVALLWVRSAGVLRATAPGMPYPAYGGLTAEQRRSFDRLAALVPPGSVVGSTLNSGAIGLYAGRAAVRPAAWVEADWLAALDRLLGSGRRVFVLRDGDEIEPPLEAARMRFMVRTLADLSLPYFEAGGGWSSQQVSLVEIETSGR